MGKVIPVVKVSKHTRFVTVKVEGKNFSTAQELTKSGLVVEY